MLVYGSSLILIEAATAGAARMAPPTSANTVDTTKAAKTRLMGPPSGCSSRRRWCSAEVYGRTIIFPDAARFLQGQISGERGDFSYVNSMTALRKQSARFGLEPGPPAAGSPPALSGGAGRGRGRLRALVHPRDGRGRFRPNGDVQCAVATLCFPPAGG